MKFLHSKRARVLALLSAPAVAAALFVGTDAARAGFPCNEEGVPNDVAVTTNAGTFVGVDTPSIAPNDPRLVYVCFAPTGGEASQRWVAVMASDPSGGGTGAVVEAGGCTGVVPGDPFPLGCTYLVEPTGAEVDPVVTTNGPGSTTAGVGGSVGSGGGTCAYVNSTTPTCPGAVTVAGITVHEGDLPSVTPTTTTPPPACTGVNNSCPGAYVIVGGDTGRDTVNATVGGVPVSRDVPRQCVQVNSVCPAP